MKRTILGLILLMVSASAWANVPNATPLVNQYTCNSATTQFPYQFQITAPSDMTVYLTDTSGNTTQLSNSVFSVDTNNVWVNYPLVGPACPTGDTITLRPATPQTQTTTYASRHPFTAEAVGASFDKLTLISQQLQGQINRAFLQPANVISQVTFPASNPGYLVGWNNSGVLANINNPAAVAQWSLSGADISYTAGNVSTTNNFTSATLYTTGNVGIGTTLSQNGLDVAINGVAVGTSYAGYHSAPSNGVIVQGNVGIGTWTAINALGVAGSESVGSYAGVKSGPSNGVIVSGNVGIGTFLTFAPFHVDDASSNGIELNPGSPEQLVTYNRSLSTYRNLNIITANVGINSANPTYALDVQGSIRATYFSGSLAAQPGNCSGSTCADTTTYHATTDGYVTVQYTSSGNSCGVILYSNTGSPASGGIQLNSTLMATNANHTCSTGGFIKSGNYYEFTNTSAGTFSKAYWTAIGS